MSDMYKKQQNVNTSRGCVYSVSTEKRVLDKVKALVRKPFRPLEDIHHDAEYRIYGGELCWKEISFNDFLAWCVARSETDPTLFDCDVESVQDAFEDWVSPSACDNINR